MPPCRPQMLHQLQTSSFLPQPVLSFHQVSANREGETRRTYAVFKLTTSRRVRCSSPPPPTLILFRRLIFSLSLSLSPFALAPSPGAMTLGYTWRKGRRGKGRERDTVDTVDSGPTKHEFSIKFNTRRKRMLGRCMMLF